MTEGTSLITHNMGLFPTPKQEPPGIGKLTIYYKLSTTENSLEFALLAEPKKSDDPSLLEPYTFVGKYEIRSDCVNEIFKEIKYSFFEQFPHPENYFNQIERFEKSSEENRSSIGRRNSEKIRMTKDYVLSHFERLEHQMLQSIEEHQRYSIFSFCSIL